MEPAKATFKAGAGFIPNPKLRRRDQLREVVRFKQFSLHACHAKAGTGSEKPAGQHLTRFPKSNRERARLGRCFPRPRGKLRAHGIVPSPRASRTSNVLAARARPATPGAGVLPNLGVRV